jgi:thymidine kinase
MEFWIHLPINKNIPKNYKINKNRKIIFVTTITKTLKRIMEVSIEEQSTIDAFNSSEKNIKSKDAEDYRLELIFGVMTAGKSTELMRRLKIRSIYKKILAVNTKKDTRYGNSGIVTHDGLTMESVRVGDLNELLDMKEYEDANVVGIDEGNFYPEIATFIIQQLEVTNKTFIIAGLNGDKDKNFFGTLHELIPHAEKIEFLKAVCKRCADGTEASFSINLVKFEGQEKVGGSDIYEAVCRQHYSQIRLEQSREKANILKKSGQGLQ